MIAPINMGDVNFVGEVPRRLRWLGMTPRRDFDVEIARVVWRLHKALIHNRRAQKNSSLHRRCLIAKEARARVSFGGWL
jgi:hypothetical protein